MENTNSSAAGGNLPSQDKGQTPQNPGDSKPPKVAVNKPVFPDTPVNKPDSISINFTPVNFGVGKPGVVETSASQPKASVDDGIKTPQVINMEIKRTDLKKEDDKVVTSEKKSFLSGLFGEKKNVIQTKPSMAWGKAIDVSKESPKTPAVTSEQAGIPEKKDFFSSISLQEKATTSNLMENIVTQKAYLEQPKIEDLLGKRSTILEKSIEQESQLKLKKKLRFMQLLSLIMLVVMIGVNMFFYAQLSPGVDFWGIFKYNFDSNLRNDLFNLNQSLKSQQTELNKYHYLSGQLYLNQFGFESTRFLDGINNLETPGLQEDKTTIESIVQEAKNNMPDLLAGAKNSLTQPITIGTFPTRGEAQTDPALLQTDFEQSLRKAIAEEKKTLKDSSSQSSLETPTGALIFFDNAAKLVGNTKLMASLKASTVEAFRVDADSYQQNQDIAQRKSFRLFVDNLLASTKVNLATISNLKNVRIQWKDVIDRVEAITNQVNTNHNNINAINASKISYSSFDLSSETGKVSVSGVNTTHSGTNREVVTYLIESFEASPEFKNVTNRSFPLSKSVDLNGQEVYTMNFKMDMELESGAFSKLNTPVADMHDQKVALAKVSVNSQQ